MTEVMTNIELALFQNWVELKSQFLTCGQEFIEGSSFNHFKSVWSVAPKAIQNNKTATPQKWIQV